jgi:UDP-N-acetylmuramate dehydrogenase
MRYRGSNVAADEVVAEATLVLRPGDRDEIREIVARCRPAACGPAAEGADVRERVAEPLARDDRRPAARAVRAEGFTAGGARISPVHANFIENMGSATSAT